jgi:hypothetical protein
MLPMGSSRRRLLYQSTRANVAYSTASSSIQRSPRPLPPDHLGFVEPVDRLCEGVVIAVAGAAGGGFKPGFGETLGLLDRRVLRPRRYDGRARRRKRRRAPPGNLESRFGRVAFILPNLDLPESRPARISTCPNLDRNGTTGVLLAETRELPKR